MKKIRLCDVRPGERFTLDGVDNRKLPELRLHLRVRRQRGWHRVRQQRHQPGLRGAPRFVS